MQKMGGESYKTNELYLLISVGSSEKVKRFTAEVVTP
jgi:hypothetical protein